MHAPERLLREADVEGRTSLSRTTIWRLARKGKFPCPVRISPGRVAWRESEVAAWVLDRVKGGRP